MTIPSRRRFLFGAAAFLAAPAIVRVASIMPVSVQNPFMDFHLGGDSVFSLTLEGQITGSLIPGQTIWATNYTGSQTEAGRAFRADIEAYRLEILKVSQSPEADFADAA